MAGEHSIKATYGLDTKQAKEALDDIKRHAERHGREASGFGKLFALEPLGIRRGAHALEGLAEGFTNVAGQGKDALAAVTQFGRSLSLGLGTGLGIGVVGVLASRFVEAREEATALDEAVIKIQRRSQSGPAFQSLSNIQSDLANANKQVDELDRTLARMGKNIDYSGIGGAFRQFGQGKANEIQAFFHGFANAQEYAADLEEKRKTTKESISRYIDNEAKKLQEAADIEDKRYHVSERAAQLQQEETRANEQQGMLSEQARITGVQNLSAMKEGNRIHEQIVERINETQDALVRESATRVKASEITEKMAGKQREIASLQTLGLTKEQQQVAASRLAVDAAGERQQLAENELEAAQRQLELSRDLSDEEKSRAQERVNRAQAGVAQARAGVTNAAAGAAATEEGRLLAQGQEEEMTASEKYAQYQRRLKQREGLIRAFARQGKDTRQIESPKYGEAEYDPLARYRATRAQEMEQQQQAQVAQEKAQRQAQEQEAAAQKEQAETNKGLLNRYQQGQPDMAGIDPVAAIEQQRVKELTEATQKPDRWDYDPTTGGYQRVPGGGTPEKVSAEPSGEYRTEKGGEWRNIEQENMQQVGPEGPQKDISPGRYGPEARPGPLPSPNDARALEKRADEIVKTQHVQPSQALAQAKAEKEAEKPLTRGDMESIAERYWG